MCARAREAKRRKLGLPVMLGNEVMPCMHGVAWRGSGAACMLVMLERDRAETRA